MVMSGSGATTGTQTPMLMQEPATLRVRLPVLTAFSAAAAGTTIPGAADLPTGAGAIPASRTTTSGFGLCCLFLPWTFNSLVFSSFTLYPSAARMENFLTNWQEHWSSLVAGIRANCVTSFQIRSYVPKGHLFNSF